MKKGEPELAPQATIWNERAHGSDRLISNDEHGKQQVNWGAQISGSRASPEIASRHPEAKPRKTIEVTTNEC